MGGLMIVGEIAGRRLVAQRLAGNRYGTAAEAVRGLLAVQSQDYPGAKMALGLRVQGATDAEIDRCFDAGEILRTHVLRPTWHFVTPEDIRWLLALTGPRLLRGAAHRHRALGIDGEMLRRSAGIFERAITAHGPQTRQELRAALAEGGIDADEGRLTHLVMSAEVTAVLCSGPRRRSAQTYALLEERVPAAPVRSRGEGIAELAKRYVVGHGPAQDIDVSWWSGLNLGECRRGLAAATGLDQETIGDRTFWFAMDSPGTSPPPTSRVDLLPNFDELLVAFRDRSDALDPALPPAARVAEEILDHVIVRDGLVVGTWHRPTASDRKLTFRPRVALASADRQGVVVAAERYAAFLGRTLEVTGLD